MFVCFKSISGSLLYSVAEPPSTLWAEYQLWCLSAFSHAVPIPGISPPTCPHRCKASLCVSLLPAHLSVPSLHATAQRSQSGPWLSWGDAPFPSLVCHPRCISTHFLSHSHKNLLHERRTRPVRITAILPALAWVWNQRPLGQ